MSRVVREGRRGTGQGEGVEGLIGRFFLVYTSDMSMFPGLV